MKRLIFYQSLNINLLKYFQKIQFQHCLNILLLGLVLALIDIHVDYIAIFYLDLLAKELFVFNQGLSYNSS